MRTKQNGKSGSWEFREEVYFATEASKKIRQLPGTNQRKYYCHLNNYKSLIALTVCHGICRGRAGQKGGAIFLSPPERAVRYGRA